MGSEQNLDFFPGEEKIGEKLRIKLKSRIKLKTRIKIKSRNKR